MKILILCLAILPALAFAACSTCSSCRSDCSFRCNGNYVFNCQDGFGVLQYDCSCAGGSINGGGIAGIVISIFVVIGIVIFIVWCCRRNRGVAVTTSGVYTSTTVQPGYSYPTAGTGYQVVPGYQTPGVVTGGYSNGPVAGGYSVSTPATGTGYQVA